MFSKRIAALAAAVLMSAAATTASAQATGFIYYNGPNGYVSGNFQPQYRGPVYVQPQYEYRPYYNPYPGYVPGYIYQNDTRYHRERRHCIDEYVRQCYADGLHRRGYNCQQPSVAQRQSCLR